MNRFYRLVRRVHMYSGLLLLPFVLLYGATGWLFNHPTHFAALDAHAVDEGEVRAAGFEHIAPPAELAAEVARLLKARFAGTAAEDDFALAAGSTPFFEQRLVGNAEANGTEYALRIDLEDKTAEFFTRPPAAPGPLRAPAPFATTLDVDESDALLELFGREAEFKLQRLFASQGIDTGQVRVKGGLPELRFVMRHGGEDWLVRYDGRRGVVRGTRVGEPLNEVDSRNFLTKLHLQKGYGDGLDWRSVWAFVVDVMSVLMLFWGLSGILMWLQMKNLRRSGALFLGAGLLVAALAAAGMLHVFRM